MFGEDVGDGVGVAVADGDGVAVGLGLCVGDAEGVGEGVGDGLGVTSGVTSPVNRMSLKTPVGALVNGANETEFPTAGPFGILVRSASLTFR